MKDKLAEFLMWCQENTDLFDTEMIRHTGKFAVAQATELAEDFLSKQPEEPAALKTAVVSADWKDIEGLATSYNEALTEFGISVIDHPDFEGSDTYAFILSNRPLTAEEVKAECIQRDEDE